MTKPARELAAAAVMLVACAAPAHATADHAYKKNEYAIIAGGAAPSKLLSVAAHGGGQFGDSGFHLYLMAEPAHRKIAPLPSVGSDDILGRCDTETL
ncbi:MAG TPA: hypothetical protein VIY51_02690 [Xanthobacteraceae bacterium]